MRPAAYAVVPPSGVLDAIEVRCARCKAWLRAGMARAVTVDAEGAWRCQACPRFARRRKDQRPRHLADAPLDS